MTNILEIILPELRKIKQNHQLISLSHEKHNNKSKPELNNITIIWNTEKNNELISVHNICLSQHSIRYLLWAPELNSIGGTVATPKIIEWTDPQLLQKIQQILHQ